MQNCKGVRTDVSKGVVRKGVRLAKARESLAAPRRTATHGGTRQRLALYRPVSDVCPRPPDPQRPPVPQRPPGLIKLIKQ